MYFSPDNSVVVKVSLQKEELEYSNQGPLICP
jgi:hypothetical protein